MRGIISKTLKTVTIHAVQIWKDPETGLYKTEWILPLTIVGETVTPRTALTHVVNSPYSVPNSTTIIDRIVEGKVTYQADLNDFIKIAKPQD